MAPVLKLETLATVLCIGAHCDDIEIGAGATLSRLAREHPRAQFVWMILSGEAERQAESRQAAARFLPVPKSVNLRFHDFRGSYLPTERVKVKEAFESLKDLQRPDLIFTHFLDDRHQDHALLAELTWNTFRSHTILEYEIPKYEGDLGHPNLFVQLSADEIGAKVQTLMDCFPSQHARSWFTGETFRSLARLRGIECAAPGGYAEAFHVRKLCL